MIIHYFSFFQMQRYAFQMNPQNKTISFLFKNLTNYNFTAYKCLKIIVFYHFYAFPTPFRV